MLRKISAVIFMLVMAMVITLKHPVLGYCLCLDTYFAGNCLCQSAVPTPEQSTCQGCCSTSDTSEDNIPTPCDDCMQSLSIDTDDFVWDNSYKISSEHGSPAPFFATNQFLTWRELAGTAIAIRGSPPSEEDHPLRNRAPIYIRHSALRL